MDAEPLGSVLVGVVMGSRNDYAVMRRAVEV
jgi:phosphoribosylcarboxyaminoimidazole (NCAIR) mutase